jgi:acyl carrier protein
VNELEQEIIDTIAEEGAIDKSEIKLDSNLYDLGIDSLSSLEILVALENKYDITIAENRLKNVNSVREIIRVVSSELKKKQRKYHVA